MEKEVIKILIEKWTEFCEFGGGYNCDTKEFEKPKELNFGSFIGWLEDNI